jgi:flagellar capping protein FliD
MNISNNMNVNKMFNALYQGNMALHSNRLSKVNFPFTNNAQFQNDYTTSTVRFVNNVRAASGSLTAALSELLRSGSGKIATSSNQQVLTARVAGNWPRNFSPMTVKVEQTATGQINESALKNADDEFEGRTGINRVEIESNGAIRQLSVNVAEGATNTQVQRQMAEAINNAGIGVRATVEFNSDKSESMLRLESTNTGSDPRNGFSIRDISGDLTERMGVGEVTQEGQNAGFSVNDGPTRTSQSNTVFIGNGITATFISASEEAVKISQGRSTNFNMNAVEDLVRSYNDLFTAAAQRTNDPRSQDLASRMLSISRTFSNSLSSIGIGFDSSGRMTISSQTLSQAAQSGRLEHFFTQNIGRNFGFTHQLSKLAQEVSGNPSRFVENPQVRNALGGNHGYSSFGSPIAFNFFNPGTIMDFML